MQIHQLPIAGALRIIPNVFRDERGSLSESFSRERYREAGITQEFVQDNLSRSRRNVLRGLHADPRMAKLVQILRGEAYDVIADIRPESPTYMQWHAEYLRENEPVQIYIPEGCLHGFLALADETTLFYKQTALYDPAIEFGIAWNDPDLAIEWPLHGADPILSAKDSIHPTLRRAALPAAGTSGSDVRGR